MNTKPQSFRLKAFGMSDVGNVRESNEDAFSVQEQPGLFIVSDGMGGARAGALASTMTVQALPLQFSEERLPHKVGRGIESQVAVADGFVRSIGLVNEMLLAKTREHPQVKGLGATVVAGLYLGKGPLFLANLGDSRAYLMRCGVLERLTEDHTVADILFQTGRINRRQLRRHPARQALTRHMGMENCPPADTGLLPLHPGDRILLCTDGLTGMIKDREIGSILWETTDRQAACRLLIDRAKEAGGRDNITAVILDAGEPQGTRGPRKVVIRRAIGRSLVMTHYDQNRT
jgi:serine/threonine protein phosphatase PrpC